MGRGRRRRIDLSERRRRFVESRAVPDRERPDAARIERRDARGGRGARDDPRRLGPSTWTNRYPGIRTTLSDMAFDGQTYVAVGVYGTILVSTDGQVWSRADSGVGDWLLGIAWSGTEFVAVGQGGRVLTIPTARPGRRARRTARAWLFDVLWDGGAVRRGRDGRPGPRERRRDRPGASSPRSIQNRLNADRLERLPATWRSAARRRD